MLKKPVFITLIVLNVLAVCYGFYASCKTMFAPEAGIAMMVGSLFSIAALAASLMYLLYGYQKNVASYFRGFMITYAFSQLASLVIAGQSDDTTGLGVLLVGAIYGPVLLLAAAKDLGKTKSLLASGIAVALQLGVFIGAVVTRESRALGSFYLMRGYTQLTLSLTMTLMTVAKYGNKAARAAENVPDAPL